MLNQSRRLELQLMLARQIGHLTRSGHSYEAALQKLRDAADGELQDEIDLLRKYMDAGEELAREEKRFATPVATLARLAGIVRRNGGNPAEVLARAEEILGPLGESYRVYWAGVGAFLWYVLALFTMFFVVLMVFSIFVFPQIEVFFEGSEGVLPDMTVFTIKAVGMFKDLSFFLVAAGVVALAISAHRIRDAMKRMEPLRGFVMRIPGLASLGNGYNKALSFNLSRLLVCAGLNAEVALNEVSRLWPGHTPFDDEVVAVGRLDRLMLTDPLKGALVLANRAGTLDAELVHLSAEAQGRFASQLARVREEFTLFAQVLVGVVIGVLLVSMYLPLFKMGEIF